jgi:hypothetical protein
LLTASFAAFGRSEDTRGEPAGESIQRGLDAIDLDDVDPKLADGDG